MKSGYRIYSDASIRRVRFIKRIQELGFSLNEIYKLLAIVDKDEVGCEDMFEFVTNKEVEIQKQIADLRRIEMMLKDFKKRCSDEKELSECPIIETLIDG